MFTQSPTKPPHRAARHLLRLARLAFPAIRVGRTTLVFAAEYVDRYSLIPRQQYRPVWLGGDPACEPSFSRIELTLRPWVYRGKRRRMQLTLAYSEAEDVCVVQNNSVWLERWR
jgi:hypothetical protein